MATRVSEPVVITLDDGVEVQIKPLVIGRMRKFMDRWEDWTDIVEEQREKFRYNEKHEDDKDFQKKEVLNQRKINDKQFDMFIDLCVIALRNELKEDSQSDRAFKDYLENNLDQPTIYKILDTCGGIDLDPENLAPALANLNEEQEWDGEI